VRINSSAVHQKSAVCGAVTQRSGTGLAIKRSRVRSPVRARLRLGKFFTPIRLDADSLRCSIWRRQTECSTVTCQKSAADHGDPRRRRISDGRRKQSNVGRLESQRAGRESWMSDLRTFAPKTPAPHKSQSSSSSSSFYLPNNTTVCTFTSIQF